MAAMFKNFRAPGDFPAPGDIPDGGAASSCGKPFAKSLGLALGLGVALLIGGAPGFVSGARAQGLLDAATPLQSSGRGGGLAQPVQHREPPAPVASQSGHAPGSAPGPAPAGVASAPSPVLQGARAVFGTPPSGVSGQRIRSFLPRGGGSADSGRPPPSVESIQGGQSGEAGVQLRRMPVNLHGYRLRGEIDATEWPVYLTDSDARSRLRFQLSYLTAISVMPEGSLLTLLVNDIPVGQTNLQAPNATRQAIVDIPPELMRPGWNSIRITADMRHRVDCSLGATYELWTQIDAANTGLLVPGGHGRVLEAQDVASLAPDTFGAFPVRAVIPGRTTLDNMDQVMKAVQGVALRARFLQPVVDVGPVAAGEAGMNLLVGIYRDIARLPGVESLGAVTGPRVALLPGGPSRRPMLVVTGPNESDVHHALDSLTHQEEARGTPSGLAALRNYRGLRVDGAGRIPLSRLNMPSVEFNGRLFRASFDLVLPPDFYTSDYAKVLLRLDGGYVAGLGPEPQISINVNGRDAATTVLSRRDGEVFKRNEIPFPLGRLKPGFNRVEILARVPSPADKTCDPVAAIGAAKRFLLLDSSELVIPTLARVGDMPNLAVTTSSAFPMSIEGGSRLFLPSPDKDAVGAAATLAAQMALAADKVLDLDVIVSPPVDNKKSTLVVAPAAALSDATLAAVDINGERIKEAWSHRQASAQADAAAQSPYVQLTRQRAVLTQNLPGHCMMAKVDDGGNRAPQEPAQAIPADAGKASFDTTGLPERDVLAQWNENIYGRTSLVAQVRNLFNNITSMATGMASGARSLVKNQQGEAAESGVIPPRTSLVMAQTVLPGDSNTVLTVVTAPNASDLYDATACLVDPSIWSRAAGQKTLLDGTTGEITTVAAQETRFFPTTVFSFVNTRLVAASWLSHNPSIYVVASLLVAIFLGGTTAWLLRNIGRKQ